MSIYSTFSADNKIYFVHNRSGKTVSPWHSVPLMNNVDVFNFVCEIPKGTTAKMEINKSYENNPICQDVKNGKPRFVTYGNGYPFNYGAFPQTFEDENRKSEHTGFKGDNDPLDVVELSDTSFECGHIEPVKVLGCLAMIDEEETDWKVITVSTSNPNASQLNDIYDVETVYPGRLDMIREWFRMYKTVDGKPENQFGLNEQYQNKQFTYNIISETHDDWKNLFNNNCSFWIPKEYY